MSDDPVKQAIIELQDLVRCRCHPAYKDRNLHDPDCHCEDADNVALVVARVEELEAKLDTMVAALAYEGRRTDTAEAKLAKAVEELENMQKVPRSDASHGILKIMISYTIAELKGENDGNV